MAIIKKITQPGNNVISTLGGHIQIDEGRGRMVVRDSVTNSELNVVDVEGFKTFDAGNENEIIRIGNMPDGTYGITVAKPGESIQSIYE